MEWPAYRGSFSACPSIPTPPLDLHEWISFEDDTDRRTWVFDATFLRSNWSCIYGAGCKGVLEHDATALAQGCCTPRRPLRRRRRCPDRARRVDPARAAALAELQEGPQQGRAGDRGRGHQDPCRQGRVHLPQPARLRRRRRLRAAHRRGRSRRALHRLEARRVLAATAAPRRITPTTTATSPRPCASGSAATGARAATTSTGGAPRATTPSSAASRPTSTCATRSSRWSAEAAYDQMVMLLERPNWTPLPHPATRR